MKQENKTIQEAIKCLEVGGKAWDRNGKEIIIGRAEVSLSEQGIHDCLTAKYKVFTISSLTEPVWTIEYPEDPQAVSEKDKEIERLTDEIDAYDFAEAELNSGIEGECPECWKMRKEIERLNERLKEIADELPKNCETCFVASYTGGCNCHGDCGLLALGDKAHTGGE